MKKSIKRSVGIRVAVALLAVLMFSVMMTVNILTIEGSQKQSASASDVLDRAQRAETAHYKWASNLSNALYAGTEFTGSIDPTTCVLGQWLYGEAGTDNEKILQLRSQMEPLHKELHQSATQVLGWLDSNPSRAQSYYQTTIQQNLTQLVGMLDQVVEESTQINDACTAQMQRTIVMMHITSIVGLSLSLIALISLILYVLGQIIRPILAITRGSEPLQEGNLTLELNYHSDNELGMLAETLRKSMERIEEYVADINRIMGELSEGNFNVHTSVPYIGDFKSIELSIDSFTGNISNAFGYIQQAEQRVSGNAEQLSSSSQSLAQGATEQASAVEELTATINDISEQIKANADNAQQASQMADDVGQKIDQSNTQMQEMTAAMGEISEKSKEIAKIIKTIEDIAFQTNILALNAAVEAARAGAAGKGFAVVADEVRNLASKSADASKSTSALIEGSVKAVENGTRIATETAKDLVEVVEGAQEIVVTINRIASASKQQAEAVAQVTQGVDQISSVIQTNSATSEESAAASEELASQSTILKELVDQFTLSDEFSGGSSFSSSVPSFTGKSISYQDDDDDYVAYNSDKY